MILQKTLVGSVFQMNLDNWRGLELIWNFKGYVSNIIYYKHLFLVDRNVQQEAYQFINQYFDNMKIGDTICVLNNGSELSKSNPHWKQKTLKSNYAFKKAQRNDQIYQLIDLLKQSLKTISNTNDLIVNVVSSKLDQKFFEKSITELRKSQQLKFIVNLFGDHDNQINISSGINCFSFSQLNDKSFPTFFKNYYQSIVVSHAEIDIQCLNAQIFPQQNSQWQSYQFNKMKKHFYGITNGNVTNTISFISKNRNLKEYSLKIDIKYTIFDNQWKQWKDSKTVNINAENDRSCLRTRAAIYDPCCQIFGVTFVRDPFNTESTVWYNSNIKQKQVDTDFQI